MRLLKLVQSYAVISVGVKISLITSDKVFRNYFKIFFLRIDVIAPCREEGMQLSTRGQILIFLTISVLCSA